MIDTRLPILDAHAHIAPDVTRSQIAALGDAVVFAMTRSLQEAGQVKSRQDHSLIWGIGVHPAVAASRAAWDPELFKSLLGSFALVGEIGLDRRGGEWARQREILHEILTILRGEPVLASIHSSGAATEVVQHLREADLRHAILHWFNGDAGDVEQAIDMDAYFSVNAATEDQIRCLPSDRVLCETDFPARKTIPPTCRYRSHRAHAESSMGEEHRRSSRCNVVEPAHAVRAQRSHRTLAGSRRRHTTVPVAGHADRSWARCGQGTESAGGARGGNRQVRRTYQRARPCVSRIRIPPAMRRLRTVPAE